MEKRTQFGSRVTNMKAIYGHPIQYWTIAQRRLAELTDTRRVMRANMRDLARMRNSLAHEAAHAVVLDESLAARFKYLLNYEAVANEIVGPVEDSHQPTVTLSDLWSMAYVPWGQPVTYAVVEKIVSACYDIARRAARWAHDEIMVVLHALGSLYRLREFVAQQKPWFLRHGAHPPRLAALVNAFVLRPLNPPGVRTA